MKSSWTNNIGMAFVLLLLILGAACNNHDHAEHANAYTCSMHPTVISDRPGTCPICGMNLVKKSNPGEAIEISEDLAQLIKSPNESVVTTIKTIKGEYKTVPLSLQAQGIVTYDTRNIYTISARVGGRLEKAFLKYPFQQIRKGQKVAEIYSPEFATAQRELVFVLENDAENAALIESAKQRLRLLGAGEKQISALMASKQPQSTFSIYSPYDGYIIAENQITPTAPTGSQPTSDNEGMGMVSNTVGASANVTATNRPNNVELIREGAYVTSGQTLFKVVNAAALRVELNVPSSSAGAVKKGSEITLDFGNDDQQSATIDLVQPFFNQGQEFLTIRAYTNRTEKLHIGHLVQAEMKHASKEGLWVPKEAVLFLGVANVVFVKTNNVLKAKKVIVGARTEKEIEIRQGLLSSDEIATSAQFLVDSESFIKTQQ